MRESPLEPDEDLTDEDQTISYPEIHTTAVNGTDGS